MYHPRPAARRTPTEIANAMTAFSQMVRLAGLVERGDVDEDDARAEARGTIIELGDGTAEGAWAVRRVVGMGITGIEGREMEDAAESVGDAVEEVEDIVKRVDNATEAVEDTPVEVEDASEEEVSDTLEGGRAVVPVREV